MLNSLQPALIIARREIRDQFRDWRIIAPILVLTLFFPGLMNFTAEQIVGFVQQRGADIIGERLIPFLLMVVGFFPISISLVIALESFVGEKERRSIEPLLSSPLSAWQLYLGKLLASMVPPLVASYLGITVYLFGIYWQINWQAEPTLLIQILALTAIQAILMVSGAVVISTQTTSVRAANLLASFIIVPMALLIQIESMIMFWAVYSALWWIIFGEVIITLLLVRIGVVHFNREELLGRELDTLNLKGSALTLWRGFVDGASSSAAWLKGITRPLRLLRIPLAGMALGVLLALWVGARLAGQFVIPSDLFNWDALREGSVKGMELLPFYNPQGILLIWWQNLRAILLATLFGIFSFGIAGMLILFFPFFVIGFFMGSLARAGLSPWLFFGAFVLPHGILEIPAIAIAGASILRLGATLAAPAHGQTIGQAWLLALADWIKILLLVAVPLLFGAAILEIYVTPAVVTQLLSGL